jgi:glutathione S-transferase
MARHLKLVSFELCPYVERSRIVLLEKGLPHEVAFIDLADKPAWFLEVSPLGRVPVLLVDGRPVFESMIINELLDELQPAPPLLPADPLARAEARGWIVFANDALMPQSFAAMLAIAGGDDGEARSRPLASVAEAGGKLEAHLARGAGPFFAGERFTLVDAAYAPFFRRWRAVESWGAGVESPLAGRPRLRAWADALLSRESVRAAEPADFAARLRSSLAERARRQAR